MAAIRRTEMAIVAQVEIDFMLTFLLSPTDEDEGAGGGVGGEEDD